MKNIIKTITILILISLNCLYTQKWDKTSSIKSKNNEYVKNELGNSNWVSNKKNILKKNSENSNPNFRKLADDYEYVWTSYNIKNLKNIINTSLKNNIDITLKEKIRSYKFPILLQLLLDKNGNIKEIEISLNNDNNFTGDDFEKIEDIVKKIKVPVVDKRNKYYSTINFVSINSFIISKEY